METRARRANRTRCFKGFACPQCQGHRLYVVCTRKPHDSLIVRYRKCVTCGHRAITEERIAKGREAEAATPPLS